MNVNLNYTAPDVETLCAAIQSLRALGIAPSVSASAPATRILPPAPAQADGPNVTAYLTGRQAAGNPANIFRLWKSEKVRGLNREQAASERMTVPGWESGGAPQGESVSVADTMSDDSEPLPEGFQVF